MVEQTQRRSILNETHCYVCWAVITEENRTPLKNVNGLYVCERHAKWFGEAR